MTWLEDANGNRSSVEYFGSREAAQTALDSLKNCTNCTNCTNCSGCSRCYDCSDCSGCYDCYDCSGCSRCSGCSDCSRCYDCYDCSGCSGCSGCSRCYDCYDCSGCSRCSGCSGCYLKSDLAPGERLVKIEVPVIENIHQRMYQASLTGLEMGNWHTCEKKHCRAGWAVTLAGAEGKALESRFNTELAAMMIYDASDPNFKINPARFYDSNEEALADMKRLAEDVAHG